MAIASKDIYSACHTELSPGNHTGYKQFKGRRTPADEITELYAGLKQSYLTDFDILLSGYSPSPEVVEAIGTIARDLRYRSTIKPGGFFWALDPVMGDQGRLYVSEDIVPQYKKIVREADLILPNQFEAELLSGCKIESLSGVVNAVNTLHKMYGVRHVVVTSVRFGGGEEGGLTVVGSTSTKDGKARCFKIEVPKLDCFFSGTGDMFAALMVGRLKEEAGKAGLLAERGWVSADEVKGVELPLARACEKVLSSMQIVLEKTIKARDEEMGKWGQSPGASTGGVEGEKDQDNEAKRMYLAETKAAEVKVVRNWRDLVEPEERYKAQELGVENPS